MNYYFFFGLEDLDDLDDLDDLAVFRWLEDDFGLSSLFLSCDLNSNNSLFDEMKNIERRTKYIFHAIDFLIKWHQSSGFAGRVCCRTNKMPQMPIFWKINDEQWIEYKNNKTNISNWFLSLNFLLSLSSWSIFLPIVNKYCQSWVSGWWLFLM